MCIHAAAPAALEPRTGLILSNLISRRQAVNPTEAARYRCSSTSLLSSNSVTVRLELRRCYEPVQHLIFSRSTSRLRARHDVLNRRPDMYRNDIFVE